jgi:GTP-binding protein
MSIFSAARFDRTVLREGDLPPDRCVEVAIAGRSNAGKSSALNVLLNRRRLARVSKTPGRTQAINFFSLGGARYLVDLPGYGYAAVAREHRERWDELLSLYLLDRASLRGLVLTCDARRSLGELDHQLLQWFAGTRKPVHVLLTKADKLSAAQGVRALALASQELSRTQTGISVQLFSSLTRCGVHRAREVIAGWMQ